MKRRTIRKNGRKDGITLEAITYACGVFAGIGAVCVLIVLYLILGGCNITARAIEYEEAKADGSLEAWQELNEYRAHKEARR